jgi:hypothetical protein
MMITNAGNRNLMQREKYTVNSAGVPLFPNVSNRNIHGYRQPRFRIIQPNGIIFESEFIGWLD